MSSSLRKTLSKYVRALQVKCDLLYLLHSERYSSKCVKKLLLITQQQIFNKFNWVDFIFFVVLVTTSYVNLSSFRYHIISIPNSKGVTNCHFSY